MFLSETFDVRSRNENNNKIVSHLSGWSVQWLEGHLNVVFGGEHDVVKCNCSQRARDGNAASDRYQTGQTLLLNPMILFTKTDYCFRHFSHSFKSICRAI